ncbi:hypothetical protein GPALN_005833 [Globodera pallida]|nr:hypothetical protein GPALN_005833 [Globodera pallida]
MKTVDFYTIFDASSSQMHSNLYMDPVAALFRIATEHNATNDDADDDDDGTFKRAQAKHAINEILAFLNSKAEDIMQNLLHEMVIPPNIGQIAGEQPFFEIGAETFSETAKIENIRKVLETIANNRQNNAQENIEKAERALSKINAFKTDQIWCANYAMENIQMISEEIDE